MGEWKTTELSPNLCTIIAGGTPTTVDDRYWNGKNVWITPNDLSNYKNHIINDSERKLTDLGVKKATGKLLPAHSVVISCRAPVGYSAIVSVPFSTNQGCKTLICHGINETFLYYVITQSTAALERVSSGTTFLELPKKELARFMVSFPVLYTEQSKIAEVLTSVDDAIDKTHALIEKYKRIKTGMMQDLLEKGEDVLLGDNRYFDINPRTTGIPQRFYYIDLESVVAGELLKQDIFNRGFAPSRAQRLLQTNDILFQMVRPYQKNNYFFEKEFDLPTVASTGYAQIRTNQNPKFVYYALHTDKVLRSVMTKCTGSNYPAINSTELKRVSVVLPTIDEQNEISEQLAAADEKIQTERDYLAKLQCIKKGLMQDLLTNAVSVDALL